MNVKNRKNICIICIILSTYLTLNFLVIFNLPSLFYGFISWMGCEEVTLI